MPFFHVCDLYHHPGDVSYFKFLHLLLLNQLLQESLQNTSMQALRHLTPLKVDPQKSASLTFLPAIWVEEGRGIHDSLECLANLVTSESSESNKDSPLAIFLIEE